MSGNTGQLPRIYYTPEFKRNIHILAKKYRHIRSDIEPVIKRLENGDIIGNQISGTSYTIFKIRTQNRDTQKGKRSGYRIIYYFKRRLDIVLVTIYSKLDQSDISAEQIRRIIREFEQLTV